MRVLSNDPKFKTSLSGINSMKNLPILRSLTVTGCINDCAVRHLWRKWAYWDYSRPLFNVATISRVQFIADKTLFGKERSPQFILLVIRVNCVLSTQIYIYNIHRRWFLYQTTYIISKSNNFLKIHFFYIVIVNRN